MGYRWSYEPDINGQAKGWVWFDGLPSEGRWDTTYNEMGSEQHYVAPPSDPSGRIVLRENPLLTEGGWGTSSSYVDSGSGLPVADQNRASWDATASLMRRAMSNGTPGQQAENIAKYFGANGLAWAMQQEGWFPDDVRAQWGPYIASRQAEAADHSGLGGAINDSVNTEILNLENIGESWQKNPERLLLGINTPLESEVWGKLLNKDYDENINMYGGPTKATYQESAERGNDPELAAWSHRATEGIIGGIAGAELGSTEYGQTTAGKASIAAGKGAGSALNTGQDPVEGAAGALTNPALIGAGLGAAGNYLGNLDLGTNDLPAGAGGTTSQEGGDMWDFLDDDYYDTGSMEDPYWDYGDGQNYYMDDPADETGAFDQFGWQNTPGDPDSGSILDSGGFNLGGLGGLMKLLGGAGGALTQFGQQGNGMGGLLGAAFNSTPFLLALAQANKQKNDIQDITGQLQDLRNQASTANVQGMVLNPYDRETALGRERLTTSLSNRNVLGSSFGNQDLTAFDTTRMLGRGDLATKAMLGSIGTQGALLDQILQGTNKMHTNTNLLLGAGLNASGKLFQGKSNDPFGLNKLLNPD